jgi:phosphatidylserine/phosphatidylglycerophosphate/cardiolipin synthase-like enzyme
MRKKVVFSCVLVLSIIVLFSSYSYATNLTLNNAPAQVYFSPNGDATEAIIKEIDNATIEIFVQAYSFTSAPVAKALVRAHKKGVKVEAILDKSQRTAKYTSATFLANSRIPTYIDAQHAIAHNKIMIIDRTMVITGSFNFTKAAEEKNAENLLIIKSKELAAIYLDNWQKHRQHSEIYNPRY